MDEEGVHLHEGDDEQCVGPLREGGEALEDCAPEEAGGEAPEAEDEGDESDGPQIIVSTDYVAKQRT